MFTGIIEEIGTVASVRKGAESARLALRGALITDGLKVGDSVAVNGVCLTAVSVSGQIFAADVMNETLSRSNLGNLTAGAKVNLERAMTAGGRFGGHIVSGHIDGTGRIVHMKRDGSAVWVTVSAPPDILRLVVEKGSVAVDGISLTVARVNEDSFAVSVIPHTGTATTLLDKAAGSTVNLENDVVGKYIERLTCFNGKKENPKSAVTLEFLANAGFRNRR
jgi:riboflavin synthase